MRISVRAKNKLRRAIRTPEGCLVLPHTKTRPKIYVNGRNILLARAVACVRLGFSLDDPRLICHHCDNLLCFEWTHLFIGTYKDNSDDCWSKGRQSHPPPNDKLTPNQRKQIWTLRNVDGLKQRDIAIQFGVDASTISRTLGNFQQGEQ